MPVFRLPRYPDFPDPCLAEPDGLLAVGGDLSVERLLLAYRMGIFPWYSKGHPILWWSPDPRLVLEPNLLHVPSSLRRELNRGRYRVTLDTAFDQVIRACAVARRPEGPGTWLVRDMIEAYIRLHQAGHAHSVEAWARDDRGGVALDSHGSQGSQGFPASKVGDGAGESSSWRLVGGMYGVAIGRAFFGESMFYREPNASKVALVTLVRQLDAWGYRIMDCQQTTAHMLRFGAEEWPREKFLARLERAVAMPGEVGRWTLDGQGPDTGHAAVYVDLRGRR